MDFTCVLKQNGSTVAATTTSATFTVRSGICTAQFMVTATAAGAIGDIVVTPTGLPAPKTTTPRARARGRYRFTRAGINERAGTVWWSSASTDIYFSELIGAVAIASTDVLSATFKFPVA